MNEDLIAKWLDDRSSLSDDEAADLLAALTADPALARQVKEQLAADELLSRRLAVDRNSFENQVVQRILGAGSDGSFTQSTLDAVERTERRRRSWRSWVPEAAAAALLIGGLLFLLLRKEGVPAPAPVVEMPAASRRTGLKAEYFLGQFLKGAATNRVDPVLDFNWPIGTGPVEGWRDQYSIRWTGRVTPRYSERYTFRTLNDDGVRVFVDGQSVINDWSGRPFVKENRGQIDLQAGRSYDIKIEYYNGGDLGVLRLFWSSPSQKDEIIPETQLSHE